MPYSAILFDFDGVLCHDRFYGNLEHDYPDVYTFIQNNIFVSGGEMIHQRMRWEIDMHQINTFISEWTWIDFTILSNLFVAGIRNMKLDQDLLALAEQFKVQWKKIAIVTNNMDVFSEVTVKQNKLDTLFDTIINSSDHWLLKHDENGKLFTLALERLWIDKASNTLLIDDSEKARKAFEQVGWHTFAYERFEDLEIWMRDIM